MHSLKVTLLLVLTLTVMRFVSWIISWVVFRFARRTAWFSSLVGNVVGLGLFTALLLLNLAPGEPIDFEALVFGVIVYSVFHAMDWKWNPWVRHRATSSLPGGSSVGATEPMLKQGDGK